MKNSIRTVTKQTCRTAIAVALVSIPSFAFGLMTPLECESDNGEMAVCASLPSDARETLASESLAQSSTQNKISLVDQDELSGGEVYSPASQSLIGSSRGFVNPAMLAAFETEEQIRRVELFLKSGPAATGDLRVVASRLPAPPQK